MKKLSTIGKIFFGILAFVIIIFIASSFLKTPILVKTVSVYCTPDCSPKELPIGSTTLARGCYLNQTECQSAAQPLSQNSSGAEVLVGFKDSIHKVQGIGTIEMLHLNVTKVYVRENNQTDWIPLLNDQKSFDIVTLNNQTAIVADMNVAPATYTQEKIVLGNGDVKINSITFSIFNRTYSLYPSSNETLLSYPFTSVTNQKNVLIFDLIVENSIKHTADGYFLYPQFNISSFSIPSDQQLQDSIVIN